MTIETSYSEISTFARCRQRWLYAYALGLEPPTPPRALAMGSLYHELLADFYRGRAGAKAIGWQAVVSSWWSRASRDGSIEMDDELQAQVEETVAIFHRYTTIVAPQDRWRVIAVEWPFRCRIRRPGFTAGVLRGVVDLLVVDEEERLWIVEHKLVSRFDYGLDELAYQVSLYLWALRRHRPAGAIYNLARRKVPTRPQLLKGGGISRRKDIDTDAETYRQAVIDAGLDPEDYAEEIAYFGQRGKFFDRYRVAKTEEELRAIAEETYRITLEIRRARAGKSPIYRASGPLCASCPYQEPCIADLKGVPVEAFELYARERREFDGAAEL